MTLEDLIAHGRKIKKLIQKERFGEASEILNLLNGMVFTKFYNYHL